MSIVIFIIMLLILVIVHEFGHFWTAKKFGVRVDEFGFGFPPKLFGYKWRETEYTFNLLPLGGFVKIFGENPDDENTLGPDKDRSLVNKAKWKQAIVLFAGVFMNFLLAWLLFSFGFISGLPTAVGGAIKGYEVTDVHLVVVAVSPKSPAENAGLKAGDKIISVSAIKSNDSLLDINQGSLKSFVLSHSTEEIDIGYIRGDDSEVPLVAKMIPSVKDTGGDPVIGISMDAIGVLKLPVFSAFYEGMKLTLNSVKTTFLGLWGLISGGVRGEGDLSQVTGPVGLVSVVGDAYKLGLSYLLSFAALISVNLAVINLVPFPALDGGRLLFLLIEKIKGSRMNSKVINVINIVGFSVLILFMVLVTYHDVVKLF